MLKTTAVRIPKTPRENTPFPEPSSPPPTTTPIPSPERNEKGEAPRKKLFWKKRKNAKTAKDPRRVRTDTEARWEHRHPEIGRLFNRLESRSLSELTRQIAPPTKNGHAPPPTESRKSSQSVNPYSVRAG